MSMLYNGIPLAVGTRLPGLLPSTWWAGERPNKSGYLGKADPSKVRAYVDYIHPLERYVVVRFELPMQSFREAFPVLKGELIV